MKLLPIISLIFVTLSLSGMEAYDISSKSISLVTLPKRELYTRERCNTIGGTTPTKRELKLFKKNSINVGSTPIDYRSLSPDLAFSYEGRTMDLIRKYGIEQGAPKTTDTSQKNNKYKVQIALIGLGATTISAITGLIVSLVNCNQK